MNFLEFGFGRILFHTDFNYPMIRMGYRFQEHKGLLIKAACFYVLRGYKDFAYYFPQGASSGDTGFWVGLSVGYSF